MKNFKSKTILLSLLTATMLSACGGSSSPIQIENEDNNQNPPVNDGGGNQNPDPQPEPEERYFATFKPVVKFTDEVLSYENSALYLDHYQNLNDWETTGVFNKADGEFMSLDLALRGYDHILDYVENDLFEGCDSYTVSRKDWWFNGTVEGDIWSISCIAAENTIDLEIEFSFRLSYRNNNPEIPKISYDIPQGIRIKYNESNENGNFFFEFRDAVWIPCIDVLNCTPRFEEVHIRNTVDLSHSYLQYKNYPHND